MGNSVIRSLPRAGTTVLRCRLPRIVLLLVSFSGPAPYYFTGDCDHHRSGRRLEAAVATRLQPVTANIMTRTFANEELLYVPQASVLSPKLHISVLDPVVPQDVSSGFRSYNLCFFVQS